MFAIVQLGASQFKVSEGDIVEADRIKGASGDDQVNEEVTFDKVLMVSDGGQIKVGKPFLTDISVKAKVLKHTLGRKGVAYTYRRRKDSKLKKGYRHHRTQYTITSIA
jgi:large subunit ribosomal protein L21